LEGANLQGAKMDGANFAGAEMRRTRGLTQAQLNTACGDASTQLPAGLHIQACR
ncbi:pentapeptide repeat-containing protein, partial [Klebsiella pneumoniae]